MDDAFGHWLAGFIDGEGHFQVSQNRNGGFGCRFAIGLRADDREALATIHQETGLGRMWVRRPAGQRHAVAYWSVQSLADCRHLCDLLERYPLRAKKARDFAIWREAVLNWTSARHERDWSRMAALKVALEAGRKFDADDVDVPEPAPVAQLRLAE
jgi:hypothetical protein